MCCPSWLERDDGSKRTGRKLIIDLGNFIRTVKRVRKRGKKAGCFACGLFAVAFVSSTRAAVLGHRMQ